MTILENIHTPADIKRLNMDELNQLAAEVRQLIISVVSQNGGHLASSLGVVELTIALYYVFDFPKDKLVWDVGHQAYAHKILSDRKDKFHTLRQTGGLAGFPRRYESPYDAFSTGHSSTSISAAFGITCGHAINADPIIKTIAVIGDASIAGGLALEALNQVGYTKINRQTLIILNNNDMSISKNVGALSSFLTRKLYATRFLFRFSMAVSDFLKSIPLCGDDLYRLGKRVKNTFKALVTPSMLFESMNVQYFGPIDGHNLTHLIPTLTRIKELERPALLHITTVKGKGYKYAEKNPIYFHGCPSFDVETGASKKSTALIPTYTKVFGDTLIKIAASNTKIVGITAAMPEGTGLAEFGKLFPRRFFDVGIAEQHGVTFAAGLASTGLRPVVAIYSTFMQRAYDQILHDVAIDKYPVIFALDRAGFVGEDGETHQGLFDLSFMRHLPNMVVMAPKDENELRHMLYTAVLRNDGPTAIRYPRGLGQGVDISEPLHALEIGQAELLRQGKDVLLIAIGRSVPEAVKAAEILQTQHKVSAAVLNARFAKPIDAETITDLAKKFTKIITVEENVLAGGFGSAVLEVLQGRAQVKCLGVPDTFVTHAPQDYLRAQYGLDAQGIAKTALELIYNA